MAATLVDRMLELADELIDTHPYSSAVKRRAVSTAYYAAFHALAKLCAETLLPNTDRTGPNYARVYRALDHGSLKQEFRPNDSPLRTIDALREIGGLIVRLQSARMLADYAPPRLRFYDISEAKDHVATAREIVARLSALSDADRQTLAVHLIFKDRNR